MYIAVTGGSGFIGSHVVRHLSESGYRVLGITRGRAGPLESATAIYPDGIPTVDCLKDCDALIHTAGLAHIRSNGAVDGRFDEVNYRLTMKIAENAVAAGVKRFVFVSTIGVHGNWAAGVVDEQAPIRAETPYSRSKWRAECALVERFSRSVTALSIVRPPMVYGERCPGNFPRLIRLAKLHLPLPFGGLNSTRSFIHVSNLASLLTACAVNQKANGVFIGGDGSNWTVKELMRIIDDEMATKTRLFPVPDLATKIFMRAIGKRREWESLSRPLVADWSRARTELAWSPDVDSVFAVKAAVRSFL